jgi:hypothetical protein
MFSIFKKKDKDFSCLGVIVQEKMSAEDFESCLNFFNKGLKQKIFNSANLETISKKLGFDIKEYYFFIDNEDLKIKAYKTTISILYRFKGSELISEENIESLIKNIDPELFYDRVAIENLSQKYGFSVFDRCQFESYTISTFTFDNNNKMVQFVVPKPDTI